MVCILAIYWVLVQALDNLQKQAELEKRLAVETHLLDVQIAEQKKRGQLLMENAELLQRQRHDLRHQLTAIQELANTDTEKLQNFLSSLMESIPALPEIFCENEAVNAVVTALRRCLPPAEYRVLRPADRTRKRRPGQRPVRDLRKTCWKTQRSALAPAWQGTPVLRFLQSVLHTGVLTVTMDNSYNGAVHGENGRFRSSKSGAISAWGCPPSRPWLPHTAEARGFTYDGSVFPSSVYLNL
ncbi:MAG: hypothetical protein ACLU9S_21420 [Oscillospiraceae bacterium]